MAKGKIEFGVENIENAFEVVKALLKEDYEVLIVQDELGNIMVGYNKVHWTDETYTLISFDEIDLLHNAKEKKESDE
jgi:5'(3')-deoxyribonucleotidase